MKSILALIFLCAYTAHAQNINYARGIINTLCSAEMYGRGYVQGGDKKAALFIADELKASKVKAFASSYFQDFGFPVVAFGGDIILEVDKHHLLPGKHFLVSPGCGAINGWFNMVWVDSAMIDDDQRYENLLKQNLRNSFIVITHLKNQKLLHADRVEALLKNNLHAKGIIHAAETKLTWSVATGFDKFPQLYVLDGWLKPYQTSFKLVVQTEQKNHQTQNVLTQTSWKWLGPGSNRRPNDFQSFARTN
jgi:aminopeptidase YwaD